LEECQRVCKNALKNRRLGGINSFRGLGKAFTVYTDKECIEMLARATYCGDLKKDETKCRAAEDCEWFTNPYYDSSWCQLPDAKAEELLHDCQRYS